MFEAGGSETRTVRIYAPPGPIHFGYAVDACWQFVENVVDPLKDFPADANCLEAHKINVDSPEGISSSGMSENWINVEVFDHQGIDTVSAVTVEAPALFSGEVALAFSTQTSEESWLFTGVVVNETGVAYGSYPLLVKVTDTESDQNLGAIQAWAVGLAGIKEGWARTWGGSGYDWGESVAVDTSRNVFVAGYFFKTVDFDPGSGVDNHTSNGYADAFLIKFDPSGNSLWARTWGGVSPVGDNASSVAIDPSGSAYVAGNFTDTIDFDPGAGVDSHTSGGTADAFLSKFDSSGDFLWTRTWGGLGWGGVTRSVAVDASGSAFVSGYFRGTADFDPGSEVDSHSANGDEDAFLSKFDSSGEFVWAITWGGTAHDWAASVAIDPSGDSYVASYFEGTADFDPGSGVDNHASNGETDACLSKFDLNGEFLWARTWGGADEDDAYSVAIDASGNPYVAGSFAGTVDFDPGGGVDDLTSSGADDAFLSKFDGSGDFLCVLTWGGADSDDAQSIAIDPSGNAFVAGCFYGTADFDPGSGIDSHTSNGDYDVFLSKFDSAGEFLWSTTWGGANPLGDYPSSVAIDALGNALVAGAFGDTVDFDPGSGVDSHMSSGYWDAFLVKFLPDGNW